MQRSQCKMVASHCCGSIRSCMLQKRNVFLFISAALLVMYLSHKMFDQNIVSASPKNTDVVDIDFSNANNITGFRDHIVPDVVHFIHFDSDHLSFIEAVDIRAVFLHHMPEKIMIHCNCDSITGKYWDMVKDIPGLELKYMEKPTYVFGKKLNSVWHASDVARLKVLMEYGGIFLDSDSFVNRPLDNYRKFEMTIGWPPGQYLGTQVLIAHPNARFLKLWYNSYKYYRGEQWYYNAGERPTKMFLYRMPHLVHRIPYYLGVHNLVYLLYGTYSSEWKNFECIHLMVRHKWYMIKNDPIVEFNEENIKTYNKTFGEMARLVIYGTSDIIKNNTEVKILSMNFGGKH